MARSRHRSQWLTLPLGFAVVLVLTSCSPPAGALKVPTDANIGSADGDMGALQGRLEGEQSGARSACFWVDGPNGRAFLVLREGSYSTAELVLHPSGAQISSLEIGKTYLFSGAPDPDVRPDGCEGEGAACFTGQVPSENPDYANATLPPPNKK